MSSFSRFSLALFRSFPAQHRVSFAIPAAFSRRKRHRDDTRAGDNGWRQKREMRILSSWRLCASFVLRPTEPEPSDRRRCPATSSASAGSFLSRCTSFCSCHLSHGLFAPHSFSRSRPLTLSLALLAGTLGQHPRYTATRSGVAALASSPAVSARRRNSFLPSYQPACLPVCPPSSISSSLFLPFHSLSLFLSRTYPNVPARLKPTTAVVPALAVTLTA